MSQFKAFAPNVEVNGETALALVEGMGLFKDRGYRILHDHGIRDLKQGHWYPLQSYLDAFQTIYESTGDFTLFNIGKKIPDNARFPNSIHSVEEALHSINIAYHMNHRINGNVMYDPVTGNLLDGIGFYKFEKTGEREGLFICENPYPSDFDRGIAESMANRYKPKDCEYIILKLDLTKPTRKKGAESCTYTIRW
ncbi:MAG: hypothetical protein H3C43_09360 [Leptonema sp. (in: Bacteria)]|nr:hypothetical protein [Leptonema sp. (in: bacteria)]